MRTSLDWKTVVGGVALLATFVLALPGVKAVRAESPRSEAAVSADGPMCSQQDPEAQLAMNAMTLEQARARAMARIAAQAGSAKDMPIVLNGRGYNYGGARDGALPPR